MNKRQISGYIMAGVGFVIILIVAINYIFHLNFSHPALSIIGLVFVGIGMGTIKKFR